MDPDVHTGDETRSNKRPHDDVTSPPDVEDIGGGHQNKRPPSQPTVTKHTSTKNTLTSSWLGKGQQSWREVLGTPPSMGNTRVCCNSNPTMYTNITYPSNSYLTGIGVHSTMHLVQCLGVHRGYLGVHRRPISTHIVHIKWLFCVYYTYILLDAKFISAGANTDLIHPNYCQKLLFG